MSSYAICIITIRPNKEMVEFYNTFENYNVYFIIDDSSFETKTFVELYPKIQFIVIENKLCEQQGYKHSSYMPTSSLVFNKIIGWDKAIYFFCNMEKKYDNVWFLEDDVFIYREKTIKQLDEKYFQTDILCRDKTPESKPDEWQWFWPAIHIAFEKPYFQSTICVVRMSSVLLSYIKKYVEENKKMFFIEAMFPSLAHFYNLTYETPKEFEKIVWRRDWQVEEIRKLDFVHPIKDISKHSEFRKKLSFYKN